MLIKDNVVGYAVDANVFGSVVAVNLLENSAIMIDEKEELHTVDIDEIIELERVGELGDTYVFNHDVLRMKLDHN
ncbi:hypothetical protein LAM21_22150, partial [Mycobacterium tuberculosis]|nr:hypothetical protein [Mycobacterium tuberculosis]